MTKATIRHLPQNATQFVFLGGAGPARGSKNIAKICIVREEGVGSQMTMNFRGGKGFKKRPTNKT